MYSEPHFLHGSVSLSNQFNGLEADEKLHQSSIVIEKKTGNLIKEERKLQVNIDTNAISQISSIRNLPRFIFPLYWSVETTFNSTYTSLDDD